MLRFGAARARVVTVAFRHPCPGCHPTQWPSSSRCSSTPPPPRFPSSCVRFSTYPSPSSSDHLPFPEEPVPLRNPERCAAHIHLDWKIDDGPSGLVGAGAFAEVRIARPTVNNANYDTLPKVVVKSFYQDTEVYYDSLNRELAALDELQEVVGVHNYLTAYGQRFVAQEEDEEDEDEGQGQQNQDQNEGRDIHGRPTAANKEGELHIVSEYIPHGDLFDFIMDSPNGQVDPINVVHMGKQLVTTLEQVHRRGWMHLDVKPENVCVVDLGHNRAANTADGDGADRSEVRLVDFGHARPYPLGMTSMDGEAGSDSYAPPEILRLKQFAPTSDTWSFGILMYAMLSGSLPWKEGAQSEFLYDQDKINLTLNHVKNRFDSRIVDLLRECLVIDVHARSSMLALQDHHVWDMLEDPSTDAGAMDVSDQLMEGETIPDMKQNHARTREVVSKLRRSISMGRLKRISTRQLD